MTYKELNVWTVILVIIILALLTVCAIGATS